MKSSIFVTRKFCCCYNGSDVVKNVADWGVGGGGGGGKYIPKCTHENIEVPLLHLGH